MLKIKSIAGLYMASVLMLCSDAGLAYSDKGGQPPFAFVCCHLITYDNEGKEIKNAGWYRLDACPQGKDVESASDCRASDNYFVPDSSAFLVVYPGGSRSTFTTLYPH